MRRTATLVLSTALFGLAAIPAAADHRRTPPPRVDRPAPAPRVDREVELAQQERDLRLYKLDAAMESEQRRADGKYARDPRGLADARARLDHWYDQNKRTIENDFRYKVDRIRAERLRSPDRRDLALAAATRDYKLRKLDAEMADEQFKADRKYCNDDYGLQAAHRRLDLWYRKHASDIRAEFSDRRLEILACHR